jgi:DNA/RNA endonuclease G (NUC1)
VDLEEQVRSWADDLGDIEIEIYLEFDSNHIILNTGAHVPTAFYKYVSFPDGTKRCYYFPNTTPDKAWQDYEIDCS